jgi:hypothetical protein
VSTDLDLSAQFKGDEAGITDSQALIDVPAAVQCLSSADCEGDLVLQMSDLTAGAQSWHYIEPGGGIECGPQMDLAQQISLQKLLPLLCGNPRFIRTAAFVACAGIRRQLLHVFL